MQYFIKNDMLSFAISLQHGYRALFFDGVCIGNVTLQPL